MDGNRRWRLSAALSTREGHAAGAERIIDFLCLVQSSCSAGAPVENLKRPEQELTGWWRSSTVRLVEFVRGSCARHRAQH